MIVQKRYPKIVLFESIFAMFSCMLVGTLLQVLSSELLILKAYTAYISITVFTLYPSCHIVIGCEVCRLWLICYDLNYLHASKNSEWSSQINETFSSENWWLANRSKYGNYRYVTRRMAAFSLSTGTISMIMLQIYGWNTWTQLIDSFLFGAPILSILFVSLLTPKVKEKFLFEFEFKSTSIFFVSGLALFICGYIVHFFDDFVGSSITNFSGIYALSAVSVISTLWIPRKITKLSWYTTGGRERAGTMSYSKSSKTKTAVDIMNIIANINQHNKKSKPHQHHQNDICLSHILANKDALDLFAQHLNSEFSSECILSFIELMQFKKYFNQIFKVNAQSLMKEYEVLRGGKIKFGFGDALKSTIVYKTYSSMQDEVNEECQMKQFKEIAYLLWQKYIKTYASLEINISSRLRAYFWDLMHDKNVWVNENQLQKEELYTLFDDICYEMFTWMNRSLSRFLSSEDFKILKKKLSNLTNNSLDISPPLETGQACDISMYSKVASVSTQ